MLIKLLCVANEFMPRMGKYLINFVTFCLCLSTVVWAPGRCGKSGGYLNVCM